MIIPRTGLALLFMLLSGSLGTPRATAQVAPDTTVSETPLEAAFDEPGGDTGDPTQLAELLADLQASPLDVNAATVDDLAQIPALGPALAHNLVRFRDTFGPFGSIPEIRAVEGITEEVFIEARPYLSIGPALPVEAPRPRRFPVPPTLAEIRQDLRVEILQRAGRRLDLGRGYDDDTTRTTYAGSPDRLYTRLRIRARRTFSANLTMEKDPGESFRWEPGTRTYGFDHTSAHLALHNIGRLQTIIVGDYVANAGQGLVLWRSTSFGKGRNPVRPLPRFGRGVQPYGSTEENSFFRGLAATVLVTPALAVSGFASRRSLDARLTEPSGTGLDGFEESLEASTLALSGLHRTPTEIAKKDAVREDLVGGTLTYTRGRARGGVAGYRSRFDRPFQPGDAPYQRFHFDGRSAAMASVYGNLFLGSAHVFGEAARGPGGVFGGVGGVAVRLTPKAEAVVIARHYPETFVSLHGHAFGERNGATQNETGYYVGVTLRPAQPWRIAAYVDQYHFPWVRYGVPRPSTGYDTLLLVEYRPHRRLTIYLQGRSETKEAGTRHLDAAGRLLDAVLPETRQSLRLHGDYAVSRSLRLRTRLEGIRFAEPEHPDAFGRVLYQDVRWIPTSTLQFDFRLALFSTDSFDARVYTYENDLLYTFSVPAFSGRGQRGYVLVRWAPFKRLTLQAKAAMTRYEGVEAVGSGLDEVEGRRLRDIRAQLRWQF